MLFSLLFFLSITILILCLAVAIVIYRYRSWFKKQWRKILAVGAVITISTAGVLIILPRQTGGADAWLGVTSSNWAGDCGHDTTYTLQNALDGTGTWRHATTETHWFILDLGQDYTVKQVRGRSNTTYDPTIVNVYVSTINGTWGTEVNPGFITTWCNTTDWVIIDTTDKVGRYIYVSISDTEYLGTQRLRWGNSTAFTIFDVYGSVYSTGSPNPPVIDVIEPLNASVDVYWQPMVSVWVNDTDGDTLSVNWYENSTGDWTLVQTNTSVSANSTVEWWFENASMDNTMYWWNATVTDGSNTTVSWNYFTIYNPVGGTAPSEETDEDRDRNGYGRFGNSGYQRTGALSICNYIRGTDYWMNNTVATADYIMAALCTASGKPFSGEVKCMLWKDTNGGTGNTWVATTDSVTLVNFLNTNYQFFKFDFEGTKPTLEANVKYNLTCSSNRPASNQVYLVYGLTPPTYNCYNWYASWPWNGTMPNPWNPSLYKNPSTINYGSWIYCSYTTIDTMIPSIDINYAGNLSDKGGPYWNPTNSTGENLALSGNFLDGYYTANSKQSEGYIYINASINDTSGIKSVYLHILNETHWEQNYTYAFINRTKGYWDMNTSSNFSFMPNTNYSFDVVANNTLGYKNSSIWRKINKGSYPGKITWSRRYVQLNSTQVNISYMPLYLVNTTAEIGVYPTYGIHDVAGADQAGADRLRNDQGPDGTINDTGYLANITLTDTMQNRWCTGAYAYYFGQSICPSSFTLNNIYYHMWWNVEAGDEISLLWDTIRNYWLGGGGNNPVSLSYGASRSNIFYDNPIGAGVDTFYLNTGTMATTGSETSFTDNNIYELILMTSVVSSPMSLCNQSIQSFILLNVPSNESLNITGDTDGDGLSDYKELYVNYTNPFVADTDNDGQTDWNETQTGSDPNNYTSTIAYTPPSGGGTTITITDESPVNATTNNNLNPTLAVTIASANGADMNITWYTNITTNVFNDSYTNVTVAYSDASAPTRMPTQRLTCYSADRYWMFYVDSSDDRVYTSSTDGIIWDAPTYVRESRGGAEFSIWVDGTDMCYSNAYHDDSTPVYRKGTFNTDGTITWTAVEQTVVAGYDYAYDSTICVDSNGYPWVAWINTTSWKPTIAKSNRTDGIWEMAYGFPYDLNISLGAHLPISAPLTDGKVYVVYGFSNSGGAESFIRGKLWNGTTWGVEEIASTTKVTDNYFGKFNVVSIGDVVHVVFMNINNKFVHIYRNSSGEWSNEIIFNTPVSVYSMPILSKTQDGDLIAFWWDGNGADSYAYYKIWNHLNNTWYNTTQWFQDDTVYYADNHLYSMHTCFYEETNGTIGMLYRNYSAAYDYGIKFNHITLGGDWVKIGENNTVTNGTYSQITSIFSDYNTKYWWKVYVYNSVNSSTEWYSFTTKSEYFSTTNLYNITIRKNGVDYFVWLGENTSAYNVSTHITGFDETSEYIGIQGNDTWSNTNASWIHYHYADKSGTNFSVKTFDVIEVYLTDAGTQVISMYENESWNYTNSKTYTWVNNTKNKGYNYTGYNRMSDTTLGAINTSVTLQSGEFIALWNKTSYTWVIYNAGIGITDDNVEQWDIILSKVEDKTAPYEVWNT